MTLRLTYPPWPKPQQPRYIEGYSRWLWMSPRPYWDLGRLLVTYHTITGQLVLLCWLARVTSLFSTVSPVYMPSSPTLMLMLIYTGCENETSLNTGLERSGRQSIEYHQTISLLRFVPRYSHIQSLFNISRAWLLVLLPVGVLVAYGSIFWCWCEKM